MMSSLIVVGILASALIRSVAEFQQPGLSLSEMTDRYCIGPDGDHRLTWTLLEQDGFAPLSPDAFETLHLRGTVANGIRAFSKVEGDRELRVLTSSSWLRVPDQGQTFYRWCWVSVSPESMSQAERDMREAMDGRGFRVERVRLFAWIPRPDGLNEAVSRRDYMREGNTLAREQGMRQVTLRAYEGAVFVGYASPRDEATYREFDWAGPEPVPAPER